MIRLLRSSFYRALKSKAFYVCLALNFGIAAGVCIDYFFSTRGAVGGVSAYVVMAGGFGAGFGFVGILTALVVGLFVGTEFSSGAARNKLICGCGRWKLYWANLITSCALCVCIYFSYHLVNLTLGSALLGWGGVSAERVAGELCAGALMTCAYASISTAIVMLSRNTLAGIVIGVLSTLVAAMLAEWLVSELGGHYEHVLGDSEAAVFVPCKWHPFVQGVAAFLIRLFPTGQSCLLQLKTAVLWQIMPLSILWVAASATLGGYCFTKIDLK